MDLKKQWQFADFVTVTAKINIEYLEGRATAEKSMLAISALIVEMSDSLAKLNSKQQTQTEMEGGILKVTRGITNTFEQYMKVKIREQQLMTALYEWLDAQGIDTASDEFADAIAVRIGNNEFDSSDHFFSDLQRFIDGEQVGYG